ncbi:MAG: 4Fe-4S binding protein [Cloacibacillus evryensis]
MKELAPITVKATDLTAVTAAYPSSRRRTAAMWCGSARPCPVRAIPEEAPNKTDDKKCVTCMRCVKICPQGARSLNKLLLCAAENLFALKYSRRADYSSFL